MVEDIRKKEMEYHKKCYTENILFESGSWLQKPVKTVLNSFELLRKHDKMMILDIGSGVGRNAIPIAQLIKGTEGKVVCIDILDEAIDFLDKYSRKYEIEEHIIGIRSSFDEYDINDSYDFVYAVSVLEHLSCVEMFKKKINEMIRCTKVNGLNCLILNASVSETVINTNDKLTPQFEINFDAHKLVQLLMKLYNSWEIIESNIKNYTFEIERQDRPVMLETDVVTFVVRKKG